MTSADSGLAARLDLETAQLRRLELASIAEATTLVLLLLAVVPFGGYFNLALIRRKKAELGATLTP